MKVFIFDTETTGFPVRDGTIEEQPYIVQFAGILIDIDPTTGAYTELDRIDELVRPRVPIPFGASSIHGIYDRDVADKPYIEERMDMFLRYLNTADAVVGHNVEFDETIIAGELARLGRSGDYQPMKSLCTMRLSTDHCQLQGRGFSFKPPKLSELHSHLFGEWFSGAHNAMVDVEATTRSFAELVKRKVIVLEENSVMRLF
ncbi:MAG TPA: 3'-5' exonuclease [bacterium]|nr:3'-5' exonuclease [bacterium]